MRASVDLTRIERIRARFRSPCGDGWPTQLLLRVNRLFTLTNKHDAGFRLVKLSFFTVTVPRNTLFVLIRKN